MTEVVAVVVAVALTGDVVVSVGEIVAAGVSLCLHFQIAPPDHLFIQVVSIEAEVAEPQEERLIHAPVVLPPSQAPKPSSSGIL